MHAQRIHNDRKSPVIQLCVACVLLIFITLSIQQYDSPLIVGTQEQYGNIFITSVCIASCITAAVCLFGSTLLAYPHQRVISAVGGGCALVAIGVYALYVWASDTAPAFVVIGTGAALGAGVTLLWIAWSAHLSKLHHIDVLCMCACGVAGGWCLFLFAVGFLVPYMPLCVAIGICTCALLLYSASHTLPQMSHSPMPTEKYAHGTDTASSPYHRFTLHISSLLTTMWVPCAIVVILEFILGLIWNPHLSNRQMAGTSTLIGCTIAAALFALETYAYTTSLHVRAYGSSMNTNSILASPTEIALQNVCLSLCILVFMLQPFVAERTSSTEVLTNFVTYFCFFNLFSFSLYLCTVASRIPERICMLIGLFSCGKILGIYAMYTLGDGGRPLSVIILTALSTVIFCWTLFSIIRIMKISQKNRTEDTGKSAATEKDTSVSMHKRCTQIAHEYHLSDRETDVFIYLVQGYSQRYIADHLSISINTVKTHIRNIYRKFDVTSKDELLAHTKL